MMRCVDTLLGARYAARYMRAARLHGYCLRMLRYVTS